MFLDLGFHPHSDLFRAVLDREEVHYPLRLVRCQSCGFVQLDYVVAPQKLYHDDYLYESSITKTGDAHWAEFAKCVSSKIGLKPGDGVVDIGSNDGTLLSKFEALGMVVCGIDPTPIAAKIAIDRGIPTVVDFATDQTIKAASKRVGGAKVITGANVLAHIDDLDGLLAAVARAIGDDGVFVFESPYFADFFDGLQYDTVYHQHLSYLSLKPLVPFFKSFGITIFDVERRPIHGGSFRVYCGRNRKPKPIVKQLIEKENWTNDDMDRFAGKVLASKDELFDLVYELWKGGKIICAVSSPAKGQTLLNYTGVGRFISFATDKSKWKQGRYTPGTHLRIYSDQKLVERQPDYAILLAWNFADEIVKNNRDFKGSWIIPIPTPRMICQSPASDSGSEPDADDREECLTHAAAGPGDRRN
jgi:SAM-dependent methyltransferase